jgi:excisionase family DNA binding protein
VEHDHDIYRFGEAAELLRVSTKTVRKMVKARELASVEYGGVTFVPAWAIDDLLCRPAK